MPTSYEARAAQGDFGAREYGATLWSAPNVGGMPSGTRGREATLYGGQILAESAQEEVIRAELAQLRELLAAADPRTTPIYVGFIKNEIDQKERALARLSESVGTSAAIAEMQNADMTNQSALYGSMEQFGISPETTRWSGTTPRSNAEGYQGMQSAQFGSGGGGRQASGYGALPHFAGSWTDPASVTGTGQSQYDFNSPTGGLPSYMSGWMTPLGARPIGAQTQMGPTERNALWESVAMQQAGNITSLADYESRVAPFISMYGEQFENQSKRLQPRERTRTALWRAPRQ